MNVASTITSLNDHVNELSSRLAESESERVEAERNLAEAEARHEKELADAEAKRARLRVAYEELLRELQLLKRRIFIGTAERVDTSDLQLAFGSILEQLDALAGTEQSPEADDEVDSDDKPKRRRKPKGRRNLAEADMPEERVEIRDPVYEKLVEEGKVARVGFEESFKLGWQKGGPRRIVIARAKYEAVGADGETCVDTAPLPKTLLPRGMAAPSLLAYVLVSKYCDGMPFNRLEEILPRSGLELDRGTMCRWAYDIGACVNASIVEAMKLEAFEKAFCIAADSTGIKVQPDPSSKKKGGKRKRRREPQFCERGHYMVMIADRDHIWFEYTPRENSEAVANMFEGYSGYVQVDANSVFNVLFRGGANGQPPSRTEVGCWAHARRKFWEASLARSEVAREALARISRIFELEASWRDLPADEITKLRNTRLKVHVDAFMAWVEVEHQKVKDIRGPLRSALGYCCRQKEALTAFLADGRLRMDNNPSELALRGRVAVGRKAWLFVGSDDHAESASGLMSLIASARLHNLDPEAYLRDIIRVLPHWPIDRNIELAPKYWAATRARLDPDELRLEIGHLTVPEPLPPAAEEQPTPN